MQIVETVGAIHVKRKGQRQPRRRNPCFEFYGPARTINLVTGSRYRRGQWSILVENPRALGHRRARQRRISQDIKTIPNSGNFTDTTSARRRNRITLSPDRVIASAYLPSISTAASWYYKTATPAHPEHLQHLPTTPKARRWKNSSTATTAIIGKAVNEKAVQTNKTVVDYFEELNASMDARG